MKYEIVVHNEGDIMVYVLLKNNKPVRYSESIKSIKEFAERLIAMENSASLVNKQLSIYNTINNL